MMGNLYLLPHTEQSLSSYILDESIYHSRGVESILSRKILLANNVDPDHTPYYVASDLGLHCLPMTLLRVSR